MKMQKERVLSIGAVALAFLASQHHALHMLALVFGLGGAGTSFMTTAPLLRRAMLLMSLVIVAVIAYQIRGADRPRSIRIFGAISIVLTLGLVGWSITQFGL
jgi:hypothetical protein